MLDQPSGSKRQSEQGEERFAGACQIERPVRHFSPTIIACVAPIVLMERLIMAITTHLSEQKYREVASSDPDHRWELWDGVLVEKPSMSMMHDNVASYLGAALIAQLDRRAYRVNVNGGKTRYTARNYYVPDVVVIPAAYQLPFERDPRAFNAFAEPLPLVVEIWSFSTGDYDMAAKLPVYRARGDEEIWYIQPDERTLTAWCRQPDGAYVETLYQGGDVQVRSLPGVAIDFDALLDG
jgi:Uma2 family endonuclease